MARKAKEKIDIDVVPYLSIMVIVLKLICLILIVTVMRVALNPRQLKVLSLEGVYQGPTTGLGSVKPGEMKKKEAVVKEPYYLECSRDTISIIPGDVKVGLDQLAQPDNPVEQLVNQVEARSSNQYIIVLMRPNSVRVYRYVRKMLAKREIDVGYDVLDAGSTINWRKDAKALNITLPGLE
jgi:hypothetical protein